MSPVDELLFVYFSPLSVAELRFSSEILCGLQYTEQIKGCTEGGMSLGGNSPPPLPWPVPRAAGGRGFCAPAAPAHLQAWQWVAGGPRLKMTLRGPSARVSGASDKCTYEALHFVTVVPSAGLRAGHHVNNIKMTLLHPRGAEWS